jgi:hypothetical protein
MFSSHKESVYSEQNAIWFIAEDVGRREHGVWLLNKCWLLFKINEVKKRQVNW